MRVLFTFYIPSGGMETLNRMRCKELSKHNIECHLLYSRTGSGIHNMFSVTTYITSQDEDIGQIIHKHNYDVIIVTSDYVMLERLRGIGYTGLLIFEAQGLGMQEDAVNLLTKAKPFLLAYCNAVILPPSLHLMGLFMEMFPSLPRFIFPNLLDTNLFHYIPNTPPPYPVLAWVGRLEPNKNWLHYLSISHHIVQVHPTAQLWMFNDSQLSVPEEQAHFQAIVEQLGLGPKLLILDNIPNQEMPVFFSLIGDSGGLLLSTSLLEGFGYAVAEAISCRCPVLSSDSDGVRISVKHNVTGKLYSQGSIEQAVQEALELIENQQLRDEIRSEGVKHISTELSPEQYVRAFSEVMNALGIF
ncbi:glycosyltransferase family 4 protein [Paenibacillus sp.]|uniref:glycosyltransferase family 4 protein n=1 Tax=Paenibacillus sp. TaxID=58172 RepID=UPI0028AC3F8B|nr:glycosyltransferase family 4 protein [Paenibacillus sp.]